MQCSGKSSVLQAILQKMVVATGSVAVGGAIAYVPQTPWVQNLSLRDNILFGLPYDEQRYRAVIHACALELDLKILPKGVRQTHCSMLRLILHVCGPNTTSRMPAPCESCRHDAACSVFFFLCNNAR
jgi:hypothetical protein